MVTIVEKAPAKINLGLKILGKHDDGYHDILSIFQTVDLYDELVLSDSHRPGLSCDNPEIPTGSDNLVLKAERSFLETNGNAQPLRFTLRKCIPSGAGLGGGSSDAAAALRGMAKIHKIGGECPEFLPGCAENLGSDVPFLLDGGTAVVRGRGERIIPVQWPFDFTYVLVYPGFGISTAWAYRMVSEYSNDRGCYGRMVRDLEAGALRKDDFFSSISNDFEAVVFPEYPILTELRFQLIECGANAAILTGSGSTMLGIFDDHQSAVQCSQAITNSDYSVFVVQKTRQCQSP